MKHQALFSSKDKRKKIKCRLLQFLFGALRVNYITVASCELTQWFIEFLPTTILHMHNEK